MPPASLGDLVLNHPPRAMHGRAIRAEHGTSLIARREQEDDVFERLGELGDSIFGDRVRPAHEAMGALGRAYWRTTIRQQASPETITKVTEILKKAAADLEALMQRG